MSAEPIDTKAAEATRVNMPPARKFPEPRDERRARYSPANFDFTSAASHDSLVIEG
jgi:hypothetical protein